jgi:hypothetical protein
MSSLADRDKESTHYKSPAMGVSASVHRDPLPATALPLGPHPVCLQEHSSVRLELYVFSLAKGNCRCQR